MFRCLIINKPVTGHGIQTSHGQIILLGGSWQQRRNAAVPDLVIFCFQPRTQMHAHAPPLMPCALAMRCTGWKNQATYLYITLQPGYYTHEAITETP
jgi:hypothetical protein